MWYNLWSKKSNQSFCLYIVERSARKPIYNAAVDYRISLLSSIALGQLELSESISGSVSFP